MRISLIVTLAGCFLLLSCRRENIVKDHPEFVGYWRAYTSENEYHSIHIEKNGRGDIEYFKNGKFNYDSNPHKWFIKDNYLLFRRSSGKKGDESYHIDVFPEEAKTTFIYEYDTIAVGQKYMIMDGHIYI